MSLCAGPVVAVRRLFNVRGGLVKFHALYAKEIEMGDIADMMLDGTLCEQCGVYIGKAVDHTRLCCACERENQPRKALPEKGVYRDARGNPTKGKKR